MKKISLAIIGALCIFSMQSFAQETVGAMGATFSVSAMGGATCSIPIEVPPGVGGLQPNLSIIYNSQSGNGVCGYGANLAGLSAITRAPKDIYHDDTAQGIKYLADDALYLDGVRLILSSGTAGQNGAVYNPESDPFTRVIAHNTCTATSNDTWFEVQSSDGMVYWYGSNILSNLSYMVGGAQKIHSWYLSRTLEPTGNIIDYYYDKRDNCMYPSLIAYGTNIDHTSPLSNVIEFTYENRNDVIPIRFDGQKGSMDRRLKSITSKTNDNIYRSYSLNYDTISDGIAQKFSRLVDVTVKNAQSDSLPATHLNWSYLPAMSYSASNLTISAPINLVGGASMPFSDQTYLSGDLNGDGLYDIVGFAQEGIPNHNGGNDFYTYLYIYYASKDSSGGVQYVSGQSFRLPPSFMIGDYMESEINALSCVDVDGDGLNELILPFFSQAGSNNGTIWLYTLGQNYDEEDYDGRGLYGISRPLFSSGDIDNNGRCDLLFMETTKRNGKYPVYFFKYNTAGNNLYTQVELDLSLSSTPKRVYLTDMNNNGLKDLLVVCEDDYTVFWNQSGSISTSMYLDSFKYTSSNFDYWCMTAPGDFNGDGLQDFLTTAIGSSAWKFFINNGDGTFTKISACTLDLYYQDNTSNDDDKFHCDVFDFDGDGKDDVVITKAMFFALSNTFLLTHTYWMRSTGSTLVEEYHAISIKADDALTKRFITGDFDGDGRMELANYGYDCANGIFSNSSPIWRIYKNGNLTLQSGKVASITGDCGATTNITYSTLTDQSIYTRGTFDAYPAPRYTLPLDVVKQTIESNGAAGNLTTQYSYEGLKVHLLGRGLLGFSKMIANNITMGVITENVVAQWNTSYYVPQSTYSRTSIGSNTAQITNTLTFVNKGNRKYFAYPSVTSSADMDGFNVTTLRSYDTDYGYILSENTTYGTSMLRAVTYSDHILAGGAYQPQTVMYTQRHPDDSAPYSVRTKYTYDSTTGRVSSKIDNYGKTKPLTTSYTYDEWGNITSQVSTGSGITTPCTKFYEYDSTHRFPVRIYTNPSSSVMKYSYNLWGNVLTEQDSINTSINNSVAYTYDGWGRLIQTQLPDGSVITRSFGWNNNVSQRWYVMEQGTARPWVKTWYDNRGREVKTESVGPNNISVSSATTYNSHGLAVGRTDINGNLTLSYSYSYDDRGRISSEIYPGGGSKSYVYSTDGNLKTVTIKENNSTSRMNTYKYDAWGNLHSVVSPASGVSILSNTYNSNGGIKNTVSNGATWAFLYDDRGNRISISDPDAGTITYVYDALGREISRTDARGVVFVTNYDYLGRVTSQSASKSGNTETISYSYGNSGTDQMRLKSKSLNGWTKTYSYDTYGRVTEETMGKANTISRTKTYTYGINGLLSTLTMPGNKTYNYTYDTYGNITDVNGAGGAVQWSLENYTGRRIVSSTVLDNTTSYPFVKTHLLDQYGHIDSIRTVQSGIWWYQDDDYNFSPQTGNLTSMKQMWMDHPHTFTYDNRDRLTSVQENNQTIMSMTYSSNGNIQSKTGIGSYTYNNSKPHAVQSVENTDGEIEMQVQDITYNLWGKVSSIWCTDDHNFYYYFAEYGPDLERVWTRLDKTYHIEYEKFQWGDYEEKNIDGVTTRFYFVEGTDGLAGLHVESDVQSGTWTHTAAVMNDHLGSILTMADNIDWCYDVHYDPWGYRETGMDYYYSIERGFTGHEQIDGLRLVDMGGRMYDPQIGRFLSPDNYVQMPSNPQSYNRYSYCLNNPLKYIDPDGESIAGIAIMALFACGMTNVFIQANNGGIDNFGDAMNALVGGAAAGLSEASSWTFGFTGIASGTPLGILLGHHINFGKSVNLTTTLISNAASIIRGDANTCKIILGRYYTDENGNAWNQVLQGLSRFTWEGPQTWAGYNWSQIRNITGNVDEIDFLGGATFCINENGSLGSVSLGNYVNADIDGSYSGRIMDYPVLMHEYGHTFDSRESGPAYLFTIGIPSMKSAINSNVYNHRWFWSELRANNAAKKYFSRYYGVDWSQYEDDIKSQYYYPTVRP